MNRNCNNFRAFKQLSHTHTHSHRTRRKWAWKRKQPTTHEIGSRKEAEERGRDFICCLPHFGCLFVVSSSPSILI